MQKEKKVRQIDYPFTSDVFYEKWNLWKEYKNDQWHFKYKSELSEQAALNLLKDISKGIEQLAINIINQSIAQGWKGLFELKNEKNGNVKSGGKSTGANELLEEIRTDFLANGRGEQGT